MSTVCEPATLESSLARMDADRARARREYDARVAQAAATGDVPADTWQLLMQLGRSPEQFRTDIQDHVARTADDARQAKGQRAKLEILAPAQEQTAEVTRETKATFEGLRLFAAELLREFETERTRVASYTGHCDAFVRELSTFANMAALRAKRQNFANLQREDPRPRTPNLQADFVSPSGVNWDAVGRGLDSDLVQEREAVCKPFELLPDPLPPEPYTRRDLAAIVMQAVGKLTAEQRTVMHDLAAELLGATTEKLA